MLWYIMKKTFDTLERIGIPRPVRTRISAGGVLIEGNKVLTIHWDPPRSSYDFPKGSLQKGETAQAACVREFREETGYSVRVQKPLGQTAYSFIGRDGIHYQKTVQYFLVTQEPGSVPGKPSRERYETFRNSWLTLEAASRLLTRKVDKEILRTARTVRAKNPSH